MLDYKNIFETKKHIKKSLKVSINSKTLTAYDNIMYKSMVLFVI